MAAFPGTPQAALRITSLSVLIYDFLITIPSEVRLYKRQASVLRPSLACIFFVLARYIGLLYICWVSFVFFGKDWTDTACARVAPVGAVLRGFVSSISAAVFIWRTWAIWGKNRYIWMGMTIVLIPVTVFSYAPGLIQIPVVVNGGCTAVSRSGGVLSHKWTFALVNLIFDTLACTLGSIPLIRNVHQGASRVSGILLADGLGYFVIAVVMQTFNLVFLLSTDTAKQGTMLTLQTIVTSILAQRIITSLSERTSSVQSSQHESRSLSGAQSSRWRRSRPPPMPIRSYGVGTGTTAPDAEVEAEEGRSQIEMIKVEVTTETLRSGSIDGHGGPRSFNTLTDQKISYAG
ncbi:hypothetical protein B0H15DRAFT_946913 [Mycena belliarum]|uniref:DUF6533 domain-containing protein n=1 Tax=Mycena belliarum TaxID=1033014 RepID=A0AAD6U8R3_9AGAR|nr:hypothetical protein B0H15DRAFT_946913 [Mycena belliae]